MASIIRLRIFGWRFLSIRKFYSTDKVDWLYMKPSVFPEKQKEIITDDSKTSSIPEINDDMIHHLEQLSLVRFTDEAAVHHLRTAIGYANQLQLVNTDGIEPMYTVLEDKVLKLRPDEITEGNCQEEILRNAKKTVEEYFVAPPGNIPLEPRTDKLLPQEMKQLSKQRNKI